MCTFHTKTYEKSKELQKISPLQRFIMIAKVFPILFAKFLIVVFLEIFYTLRAGFYWIVPPPMIDIRGQLAAVSVMLFYSCLSQCAFSIQWISK